MSPPNELEVEEKRITSFDGTEIAYHSVGQGPVILLGNGLGGSWRAWTHQIGYFVDRFRFVSWDYRGLYRSGPPRDRQAIRVEHHARDGLAVLDDAGIDRAIVFGWSMGVQVGLELYRSRPDAFDAMVLFNGVPSNPYSSVLNAPRLGAVMPGVLGVFRRMPTITQKVTEAVVTFPYATAVAKTTGLASKTLDDEVFTHVAESFKGLDMNLYLHILQVLGEHDGRPVLDAIEVPTLVVAGARDIMTPVSVARNMAERVRDAELMVVPGGTHYVVVEYPELVNLRLERFFEERLHVR